MSDLKELFDKAAREVTALPEKPGSADLLRLYALFKQASEGDASGEKPGMANFVARAKYEAWSKLSGTTRDAAMQQYIDLVTQLKS